MAHVSTGSPATSGFHNNDYKEVESNNSSLDWAGCAMIAEVSVGPQHPEVDNFLVFAFIVPAVHPSEVLYSLRAALAQVQPLLPVGLLPSSHGAMLLRCES